MSDTSLSDESLNDASPSDGFPSNEPPSDGFPSDAPLNEEPLSEEPLNDAPLGDGQLLRCMQNRELSWLRFNERVLEEASDTDTPLFERLFFLSVFTSNLDEFFMVRVGSFQDIARSKATFIDSKTGMDEIQLLEQVFQAVAELYPKRDAAYAQIEAELNRKNCPRRMPSELDPEETSQLSKYYQNVIAPLLAPQVVDKTHPFPHLENKRLIVALSLEKNLDKNSVKNPEQDLEKKTEKVFGMIPLPRHVDRLFFLKEGGYILLEDILFHYSEKVFKKYTILEKAIICVTRNADLDTVKEQFDIDEDFRDHMTKLLKRQKRLAPVRVELQGSNLKRLPEYLCKRLELDSQQVFYSAAPLDLSYHSDLREQVKPKLREYGSFPPFEPVIPAHAALSSGLMKRLRQTDIMLFHPYESIQPFLSFVKEASEDKNVLSIQIVLYRLAEQSRLVEHLIAAVENGKRVVVFIELRARMDEENNIGLAKRLEEAGCSVFYGQLGYKMHGKITLVTRRDLGRYEHFVHIGTGNYNEKTVKSYTDISLMTTNKAICEDAISFFQNMLIGAVEESYPTLWVAPQDFKSELIKFIRREASLGEGGLITIKCNSLTDKDIIGELVKASRAGTRVNLILRAICCLVPGIEGYTDNIHIRSIVGRFLEHSRIYRFGAGVSCDLYIGSGDMMTRNTTRRVELFAPIFDQSLRARIFRLLDIELQDNVKARVLVSSGEYVKTLPGETAISSQQFFIDEALARSGPVAG